MSPILAVDMFPRTRQKSDINLGLSSHVESVVLLSNKNSKKKDYAEIGVDAEDYYKIKANKQKFGVKLLLERLDYSQANRHKNAKNFVNQGSICWSDNPSPFR